MTEITNERTNQPTNQATNQPTNQPRKDRSNKKQVGLFVSLSVSESF